MRADVAHLHLPTLRERRPVGKHTALEELDQHILLLAGNLDVSPVRLGDGVARGVEPGVGQLAIGRAAVRRVDYRAGQVQEVPELVGDVVLGFGVVVAVLDPVLLLNFQVSRVRTRGRIPCQSFQLTVNVHVECHDVRLLRSYYFFATGIPAVVSHHYGYFA